jgi:serine/threonine protein kinase
LGCGGDGKVYVGRNVHTLEKVAMKIISKNQEYKKIKRARREYNIMSQLNHKHIVRLIDVVEDDKCICIVMEYAPAGDLFDYISKCGKLDQVEAQRIFKQLVSAVGYLHAQGFIHRDIKPENVCTFLHR